MTNQEQRILIAEFEGWKRGKFYETSFADPSKKIPHDCWISPTGINFSKLPDYHDDADALKRVMLRLDEEQRVKFIGLLVAGLNAEKDDSYSVDAPISYMIFRIITVPNTTLVDALCAVIGGGK